VTIYNTNSSIGVLFRFVYYLDFICIQKQWRIMKQLQHWNVLLIYFVFIVLNQRKQQIQGSDRLILYLFAIIYLYYRHPTSCASMAEITSVLFFNVMRYDPKNPRNPAADRFVLSKVNMKLVLRCSILNYVFYFRVIVLLFYMLHGLKLVHFQ